MAKSGLPHDDELIPLLLAGDDEAFRQVVAAHHGLMVHLATNIVGSSIAEEVAQEAWVSVMRALPKFERRSSLKTWILTIVGNTAKTRLRHESRTVNFEEPIDQSAPMIREDHFRSDGHWTSPPSVWQVDTPEELLSSDELRDCIDNAIKGLPPLQRAALGLREMQGIDMESICKILDISESNGRVLIHRARSQIREAIDDHFRTQ